MASTDLIYFASGRLDAPGAMFTASHNPAKYNGVKLCLAGAKPVGEETGLRQIRDAVASGDEPAPAERPGTVTERSMIDDYRDHVRTFVDLSVLRPLKVVADTANGMGGLVAPKVFAGLPFGHQHSIQRASRWRRGTARSADQLQRFRLQRSECAGPGLVGLAEHLPGIVAGRVGARSPASWPVPRSSRSRRHGGVGAARKLRAGPEASVAARARASTARSSSSSVL